MNFECLTKEEVKTIFRQAKHKRTTFTALCEITCARPFEMVSFLGIDPEEVWGRMPENFDEEKALDMWESKKSDVEISKELGVSKNSVVKWRRFNGLQPKHGRKEDKIYEQRN